MISDLPFNVLDVNIPKTFLWKGDAPHTLYWDEAQNWEGGEVPNAAEATVVFPTLTRERINIALRGHVAIGNLWFDSAGTSYNIYSEGDPENSALYFVTGQPLANIVLTEGNTAAHTVPLMIMHSCKQAWGPGWKSAKSLVFEDLPPKSKITFSGKIGSYKPARRSSLILDGFVTVELFGENTFVGPIEIRRGLLEISQSHAIPSGITLEVYSPGKLYLADGVAARVGRLIVDGQEVRSGNYGCPDEKRPRDQVLTFLTGAGELIVG